VNRIAAQDAPWGVVAALGVTQITAWGSIYYSFALLMEPLQAELGATKGVVVGAFSLALLLSGLLGPLVGRVIDRRGGREVMAVSSMLGGASLVALAYVDSVPALYAVWTLLGVAMAGTLYDPAFAVLARAFRRDYRKAITGLTLFGGFANTVFWPFTAWLMERYGWREAMMILGALNVIVCVPLHLFALPPARIRTVESSFTAQPPASFAGVVRDRRFYLLCAAFTGNALVFSAMSVHMIAMLSAKGLTAIDAALVGAMVGPMQVTGRVLELMFGRQISPSKVGLLAMVLLPLSLLLFLIAKDSMPLFALFAFCYGAGNGVMTIVRGTIPAELYGTDHYGAINGAMAAPVLISKATGPLAAAALYASAGGYVEVVLVLTAIAAASVIPFTMAARRHDRNHGVSRAPSHVSGH
jgi:MFS family permease